MLLYFWINKNSQLFNDNKICDFFSSVSMRNRSLQPTAWRPSDLGSFIQLQIFNLKNNCAPPPLCIMYFVIYTIYYKLGQVKILRQNITIMQPCTFKMGRGGGQDCTNQEITHQFSAIQLSFQFISDITDMVRFCLL